MASSRSTIVVGDGIPALSVALALSAQSQDTEITLVATKGAAVKQTSSAFAGLQMLRLDYPDSTDLSFAWETQRLLQNGLDTQHSVFPRGHIYATSKSDFQSVYSDQANKPETFDHLQPLDSIHDILRYLPSVDDLASHSENDYYLWQKGYRHRDGSVIDMDQLETALYRRCLGSSNITFQENTHVEKLIIEDKVAKGIKLTNDSEIIAEKTVLAAGPHSGLLVDLSSQVEVTGYDTTWLKPSKTLLDKYKNIPVLTNSSTGFTVFPPVNGEFKCSLQSRAYGSSTKILDPASGQTVQASNPEKCAWSLSPEVEQEIRHNLGVILPELSAQPLVRSVLSWHVNANDGQSLIDQYPGINGLFVVVPSSQHEPLSIVLAEQATKHIYGSLDPNIKERWAFKDHTPKVPKRNLKLYKPIVVVGAGVFGLTTALHLAQRGYKNVTMLDRESYDEDGYSSAAASADRNKIIRASYGKQKLYESLAFKALDAWEEWNSAVRASKDLPNTVTFTDRLWDNCGFVRAGELPGLEPQEAATQESFPDELKHTQYRLTSEERKQDAVKALIPLSKLDPFERLKRGLGFDGILDGTGGYVAADKSCSWALHLCQKLGVRTKLGPDHEFKQFLREGDQITGVQTRNGTHHPADLVIVAGGGWTPSIVPEVADLLQTTAGSVIKIQLPENRPDLWKKYSSSEFPCWSWRLTGTALVGTEVGGIYGFPRTSDGVIKIGFRGVKWTNFAYSNIEGRLVSYPEVNPVGIPNHAMDTIQQFCKENMPDLVGLPVSTRLCWYTDSPDSNFLIDYVPGSKGLMVASGGSGHGFKFLPVLGEHVVDVVEKKDTPYVDLFKWRDFTAGGQKVPANITSGGRWPSLERSDCSNKWKSV